MKSNLFNRYQQSVLQSLSPGPRRAPYPRNPTPYGHLTYYQPMKRRSSIPIVFLVVALISAFNLQFSAFPRFVTVALDFGNELYVRRDFYAL